MSGLALAAPFLALLPVAGTMAGVICALIAFGLGRGFYECNTMPVLRDVAGAEQSATGYGVLNMAGCLAGGAAVAAAGFLKQHLGLGAAFQAAAAMLALGALALWRVRTADPPRATVHPIS